VGSTPGLGDVEHRKISCPSRELNPGHPAGRPSIYRLGRQKESFVPLLYSTREQTSLTFISVSAYEISDIHIQTLPWKADSYSADQENYRLYRNRRFIVAFVKGHHLALSQMNPVHIFSPYFPNTNSNSSRPALPPVPTSTT
jgi:hypothetical protein